jgi:protein-S-isoprenylcysteine O-methyltransferase Ste14
MSFHDPIKTNLFWIKYLGLIVFVIGSAFVILSHLRIKGYDSGKLITTGIYSKIRHPMYLGFILWIIGFPLFMQSIVTFALSILWIPQILYWKISEEKSLEKKYEKYIEYKKRTWF